MSALLKPSRSRAGRFSSPLSIGALVAVGVLSGLASAQSARIGVSASSALRVGQPVALADSTVPALASSRLLGSAEAETISATVSLRPRDLAGLQAAADAVSEPTSSRYRQYLTPQEIGDRFGASQTDRSAVASYFASQGLQIDQIAPNGMAITIRGASALMERAFATKISYFRGPDASGTVIVYRANQTALQVPAELAKVVTYVSGLETYTRPQMRATTTTLDPRLAGIAYGVQPSKSATTTDGKGYNGQGRHLAISNFDAYRLSDASLYITKFGLPYPEAGKTSNISTVVVGTASTGTPAGEGDLDIQMALSQAPLSDIRIYDRGNSDLIGVLTRISTDDWADVVTESYGWGGNNAFYNGAHNQHLALTAQGITYMCASGDSGTNIRSYPYPDFDPEVLMVGGSIVAVDSTTGARSSEIAWTGGGGGWFNTSASTTSPITWNVLPSWQKGTNVPTNVNRRLVPDVAFHAAAGNPSNYAAHYVYDNGTLSAAAGTSASSPLFAASLTTMEGRLYASSTSASRPRLGRLQNLIYGQNGRTDVYNDITSGSIGKLPSTSTDGAGNGNATTTQVNSANSYSGTTTAAGAKWDFCTGWGSINVDGLYRSFFNSRRP